MEEIENFKVCPGGVTWAFSEIFGLFRYTMSSDRSHEDQVRANYLMIKLGSYQADSVMKI